jgi:hypothetical protein
MTQLSVNHKTDVRPGNHTPPIQLGLMTAHVMPSVMLTDPPTVNDKGGEIQGRV